MKTQSPVNPNATKNAKELLSYLYGIAGKAIITGQHTQTVPMEEITYIKEVTGQVPKLRGFELLAYSPNINYQDASEECLKEVEENKNTLQTAFDWAQHSNGILTFSFHWFSPIGGRDKSFYAKNTDFDARKILEEGSKERDAFFSDMDKIANLLKPFKEADIPVLWRPFHESDGDWFWWGAKGPEVAKELYKLMFDRYVNFHHLDNLLWVWNCRLKEGWPGDEFTDVISVDIYRPSYSATDYKEEYDALKSDLGRYMEDACKSGGYDLLAIMLTNPNGSGSYVLSAGARKRMMDSAFKIDKSGFVNGLVSRKKQLLPGLIAAFGAK